MFYGKGAGSLATGSVVSDLLNVALFFESNTHTLPPHFELKTDATREIMDTEDVVAIQEKLNYYIVLNSDLSKEKFKSLLKETLPFHKSLQVEQRDEQTYGVVIIGLDQSPEDVLSKAILISRKFIQLKGLMFMKRWQGLVEEFKEYLPVNDTPKLTLNEGHTPLIHCENLSKMLDIDLYVKYEGANPTGSFKDRGMVMAVTKAKEQGKSCYLCIYW